MVPVGVDVDTAPMPYVARLLVRLPSTLSEAVAPGSEYVAPVDAHQRLPDTLYDRTQDLCRLHARGERVTAYMDRCKAIAVMSLV